MSFMGVNDNILTTFRKFPELPLELRGKIWGFAVLSRIVQPHVRTHRQRVINNNLGLAIAHTSKESRRVYMTIKNTEIETYYLQDARDRVVAGTRRVTFDEDTIYVIFGGRCYCCPNPVPENLTESP